MDKIKYELKAVNIDGGMKAILVNCIQKSNEMSVDTNVRVFNDEWNESEGLIDSNPNYKTLNKIIRKTVYDLETLELDFDGEITLQQLSDLWNYRSADYNFYSMMESKIKERDDIRNSTKEIHARVLKHLKEYKKECMITDLTEEYTKGFIKYMKDIKLSSGTIAMHVRVLRAYYHIAAKMYGNKVPKMSFDFYHEKLSDRLTYKLKSLDDNDIRFLENYIARPDTPQKQADTMNKFLFMSYTGLRISDFDSLTKDNISYEHDGMWLNYISVKTDTPVRIPLFALFDGRAEQIINRYKDKLDDFFNIKSDAAFNSSLQSCAKKAHFNKHITAHVARHTCASRLINKDVPVTTIQKIIGHRSIKMTMIYANTNENTLVRQLIH